MSDDRGEGALERGPGGPGGAAVPAALEQDFDAGSLYALRSAVSAHAAAAGLDGTRVYDVVAAAHELAANAVRHGAGHGHLRLWADGGVLTCEVSDAGAAPNGDGKTADEAQAPWPAEHSHGLWVVEQVADQFTIDRGPLGTTATATFTFDALRYAVPNQEGHRA
jgi:anti-sigma regulatory factor (Ser/Thr protein kinase)